MIKIKIKKKLDEAVAETSEHHGVALWSVDDRHNIALIDLSSFRKVLDNIRKNNGLGEDAKVPPKFLSYETLKGNESKDSPSPILIGYVQMQEYSDASAPCLNAMNMNASAVHEKYKGMGFGKLLYKLGLAFSAKKFDRPVMGDRFSISDDAANIWNSFAQNRDGDVTSNFLPSGKPTNRVQSPSDANSSKPKVINKFDLHPYGNTEYKIDDCPAPVGNPDPDSPVNRAYYSKSAAGKLSQLDSAGRAFLSAQIEDPDAFEAVLLKISEKLFDRLY